MLFQLADDGQHGHNMHRMHAPGLWHLLFQMFTGQIIAEF
jgi:hypothetical protein